MKEYFVLSDIHSFYNEMMEALKNAGFKRFDNNHIIIVCGDLIDRGDQTLEVVSFLHDLLIEDRCILIRGNHEDLFDDMVSSRQYHMHDIHNGTLKSLGALNTPSMSSSRAALLFDEALNGYNKKWDYLKNNMVDYYELGKYIFVHGWIPCKKDYTGKITKSLIGYLYDPEWRDASKEEWANARWYNGMEMSFENIIEPGKIIVCGHWHTSYGHVRKVEGKPNRVKEFEDDADFSIYYGEGIIALDACTAHTGFCNCLHLRESDIYETENSNSR